VLLGHVFERFVERTPFAVMSRSLLERTLTPEGLDALFEEKADAQYTRELTFSSVVDLMGQVVTTAFPSVRAAFLDKSFGISVSLTALYNKLQGIEPGVAAELVRHSARQLQPLIREIGGTLPEPVPGYPMHVLDGNNIAATEHRLSETRGDSAAPLPGKSLCVFRPAYQLVTDIVPCEDGHAQERSLVSPILDGVEEGSLWLADRNFCFQSFLLGIARKLGFFIIREHANLKYKVASELRKRGRGESGEVLEQTIVIEEEDGTRHRLRRIVVKLGKATGDGDWELAILTNLPGKVSAVVVSEAYRKRWTIEGGFLDLTTTLDCEINTLCYPKAALFVFCVAVMAYNLQSAIKGVMRSGHGAEKVEQELSRYFVSDEIAQVYRGMMVALPPEEWAVFRHMSLKDYVAFLKRLARNVDFDRYPKSQRGPKKAKPKRRHDPDHPHVSVAKLLLARKLKTAAET
jgi:VCBS repeat-containing protein